MLSRRRLLALMIPAAFTPIKSWAQSTAKLWRIGLLAPNGRAPSAIMINPFIRALNGFGHVEHKSIVIEARYAEDRYERLPGLVKELLDWRADILVPIGTIATLATKKATNTVAIVGAGMGDPVANGLAASLARPGGNVTGWTNVLTDLSPKLLELMTGMIPKLHRVSFLRVKENPLHDVMLKALQTAALKGDIVVQPVAISTADDLQAAFTSMRVAETQAVILAMDSIFVAHLRKVAELARANRLPSIINIREYARAGGLISYGQAVEELARVTATYVDRIIKGAKPSELPIEQPLNFRLGINLNTAREIGIEVPRDLLLRADEVIG